MFSFTDTNVLTAAQLNGNFAITLDKNTATTQSVTSLVNLNGGCTTTSLTISGLTTHTGAEVNNVVVLTAAGNYVVISTDRYVVLNKTVGAATQITLPSSATIGRIITVKDAKGDASSNNITVVPSGADTIDGAANNILNTAYAHAVYLYVGAGWSVL